MATHLYCDYRYLDKLARGLRQKLTLTGHPSHGTSHSNAHLGCGGENEK